MAGRVARVGASRGEADRRSGSRTVDAGRDCSEHGRRPRKVRRLLRAAAAADQRNVRLVLERLDESAPPAEQLLVLDGLDTQDPDELGLIAARRALAHLLVPDAAAAREALNDVRQHIA